MNPYAPPKAALESAEQAGGLWRDGNLVRMDRDGVWPDRCVVCDAPAAGMRVRRKLYWSPLLWRLAALATPFVAMAIGAALQVWWLFAAFWPLVLLMIVAHLFVRKSLRLELAVCRRHRRMRDLLTALGVATALLVIAGFGLIGRDAALALKVLIGAGALAVSVAIVQAIAGVHRVRLRKLDDRHAWLSGVGVPFRQRLAELAG